MFERERGSTNFPYSFFMASSTDHITGVLGISPTVTISKNGGAFGAVSGAVAEIGNGWYSLAGDAGDRDTVGELLIHAEGAGADPFDGKIIISPLARLSTPFFAVVTDGANTAETFKTDRTEAVDGYWKDVLILFLTGGLAGQSGKKCTGYNGTTKFLTSQKAFTAAPNSGDVGILLNR